MGYIKEQFGLVMLGNTPKGTCPLCAVKHNPALPHNRDSLAYQYKFYDEHGRWPTWKDAMAHCSDGIKNAWMEELRKLGINIEGSSETRQKEIEIKTEEGKNE